MLAVAALRAHGLRPRREREAAAHHEQEAHGAGSLHRRPPCVQRPDRPLGPPALCPFCIPLGLAGVAKWPLSDSAPQSSPSSALCPVAGPGLCRRASPSQVRRRRALCELRVLLVAFLQKAVSPGARRGAEGVARTELFVCSSSPESWIPWHGFSPPSGFPSCRRETFQLPRAARGAAWLLRPGGAAPAACASSLWVRDWELGLGGTAGGGAGVRRLRPEGTQVGEWRANRAEIRSSHTLPPRDAGGERGDDGGRTDPDRGRRKR